MEDKLKIKQLLLSDDKANWTLGLQLMVGMGISINEMIELFHLKDIRTGIGINHLNYLYSVVIGYCKIEVNVATNVISYIMTSLKNKMFDEMSKLYDEIENDGDTED